MTSIADEPSDAERVFRIVIERGFSQGDLAAVDAVVAPDFIEHQRGAGSGVEALKELIKRLRGWFPDLTLTIEALVVSGDTAWGRIVARATHSQTTMGQPPTGRSVRIDIVDIMRIVDGRMIEHWGVPDQLALLEQIGAIPTH